MATKLSIATRDNLQRAKQALDRMLGASRKVQREWSRLDSMAAKMRDQIVSAQRQQKAALSRLKKTRRRTSK